MSNLNNVDWSELPTPEDDGGAAHLTGLTMPSMAVPATDGSSVDLSAKAGLVVVYAYPMTGVPGVPLPDGWDDIPGARGCTPQSCHFRDHAGELKALGVSALYGLSTQASEYQKEAAERLQLPFPLLSDQTLELCRQMRLPAFDVEGKTLFKRFTLVINDGVIETVFYPVFPPDRNASDVIAYLQNR